MTLLPAPGLGGLFLCVRIHPCGDFPGKNLLSMEQIFDKTTLIIHVVAGASTLIAGPIAIFYNFKDPRKHRLAGKVFFYAMLVVCFTAWIAYFKHPEKVFFQFLCGISTFVFAGVLRGVRAMRFMKKQQAPGWFDWGYTTLLAVFGIWMLWRAVGHFMDGSMVAFPILFAVFGGMSLWDTWRNIRFFRPNAWVQKLDWYRLHVSSMIGAFMASSTAFTVNAATFLPWYLQWFGPTLALLPLQIYFGRKLKRQQKQSSMATA